jgi:[acyl-carrier-protein] S-malonyltransferase
MNFAGVFPGQGSQSVGMLAGLAAAHREVTDTFAEASEMLRYDLWRVCQTGPEEQLNRTECTQPAMLAAGTAVWRVWCVRGGPTPDVMGGHSLGEYTALVCAGGLAFADAVALVADRGRFMQEAVPYGEGAVAAILGLDDTSVIEACEEAAQGEVIRAVNFNAPGQVVVAGHTGAVERALEIARARGARKALRLPLSVPVHSPLMKPAAMRFAQRLGDCRFSVPPVPVVSNVDLHAHASVDGIRENLAKQLYSPVRWSETIEGFHRQGVALVVESGPGKVLAGLNRRIARDMRAHALVDVESIDAAIIALRESP